eukprot:Transcript_8386.p1 GENE.Transcript_8386~~Transcript_8386.p1  ORF type:complete len:329 (+),score=109.71 Transcript_8386:100-987(+)
MSVFIGNISQGAGEDDVMRLFSQAGRVRAVRLVIDKESGKHRNFGFVDYYDDRSMQEAVDLLHGVELKGKILRVDCAASGPRGGPPRHGSGQNVPTDLRSLHYGGAAAAPPVYDAYGGGGGGGGGGCGYGGNAYGGAAYPPPAAPVAQPTGAGDTANMSDMELWDIVAQMKTTIQMDVEQTRRTLTQNPAMGMAVLRAQIRLGMVTPQSIAAVMRSSAHAQPPPPQTPVQAPPPPAAAAAAPPPQGAQGAALNAEQQALVQQVMQLTQEQIDALPAGQREQLMMLRQQVMSGQLG